MKLAKLISLADGEAFSFVPLKIFIFFMGNFSYFKS